MDVQTRKSILWDAFEELKNKWSVDERFLEQKEEEPTIDGLPESRVNDLMAIKEKYQLDDLEFLFIVGTAVGLYQGQKHVKDLLQKKMSTINEFVSSLIGREL
ncbi:hypothetical protein [Archaeoglobus sp.]